ncbi:MAG TPA: sigma-70 family RNA polymerase sigma factor [Parapedobacter sp.]|uniref:RNA polymerase sigma factor n=1 Tax=Parapedobacter sp. TaxID=1958893 RepID=UPI002CF5AAC0|nr:sigma-70 family RNA polymerase sigma factor [Parapedobacter sp.]HWK57001.1 sigma-70 family RNA polymerase sigma factor [Parapedobacter sp.]
MDQPDFRLPNTSLVERIKSDDEVTLKNLYTSNYRLMERYVLRHSGSVDDAKDTYQEAFLAVWRNVQLGRFVPSVESDFAYYLTRVVKNKWIDSLRKAKGKRTIPIEEAQTDSIAAEENTDEVDGYIDNVRLQYKNLGGRCRELLAGFYFKRNSLRDIASAFGWTESSAKNNKYRCLKQLREMVLKNGGTNG